MTGNPLFDKILLGANGVLVLAAAGLVVFSHVGVKPPATNQRSEEEALVAQATDAIQLRPYAFKPLTINLFAEGTRLRYLEVEMHIALFKEADRELIKQNEHIFKNAMLETAGKMTPDELSSVTGKILLESRFKKAVHDKLGGDIIKKVFYPKFIVQ